MGDDVISCSPVSRKSLSFRKKRKDKFQHSLNSSSFLQSSETSTALTEEDLFEEEYDLVLAEMVPPSKPCNIDPDLLSQSFVNLEDLMKSEAEKSFNFVEPKTKPSTSKVTTDIEESHIIPPEFQFTEDFMSLKDSKKADKSDLDDSLSPKKSNPVNDEPSLIPEEFQYTEDFMENPKEKEVNGVIEQPLDIPLEFQFTEDFLVESNVNEDLNRTFVKESSNLNETFMESPKPTIESLKQDMSVIDQILQDFEISPKKPMTPKPKVLRTYTRRRMKAKSYDSDTESSISWQEELNRNKPENSEDFSKSQVIVNQLLNLSNFFCDIDATPLEDLDCTQRAVPEEICLRLSFSFQEEEGVITYTDEYDSLKFNDFYEYVFDGKDRSGIKLFEGDDLLEDIASDTPKKSKDLSILCGNTELFTDFYSEELVPPEIKDPPIKRLKKPTAKRKLSLEMKPSRKRRTSTLFEMEGIEDLNTSKCNIEDEPMFEGFEATKIFESSSKIVKSNEISKIIDFKKPSKVFEDSIKNPQPSFSGMFQTAGKKSIKVSEESLKKSSRMYDEVMKENLILDDFNKPKTSLHTSGRDSSKVSENFSKSLQCKENPNPKEIFENPKPSFTGMFQTAGKKAIKVSEESLKRSSRMYDEIMKEDLNLEDFDKPKPTFQTSGRESCKISENCSKSLQFNETPHPPLIEMFQTPGKKTIKVSEESLKRSSRMYDEIIKEDLNLEDFEKPKPKISTVESNTNTTPVVPTFSGMFQTAGKKTIKISAEAQKKSVRFFEDVLKEEIDLQEINREKTRFNKENIQKTPSFETPTPKNKLSISRAKSSPNLKAFCDNAATTSTPIPSKYRKKLTQEEISESVAALMEDSNSFDETTSSKNVSISDRISMLSKYENPPPLSPITPVSGKTVKRLGLRRFASFQILRK